MAQAKAKCTLLTTHALVLLCIARNSEARIRDIAEEVGVTERTAHSIVTDLVREGYVERTRAGRRNVYVVNRHRQLAHPLTGESEIGELLAALRLSVSG